MPKLHVHKMCTSVYCTQCTLYNVQCTLVHMEFVHEQLHRYKIVTSYIYCTIMLFAHYMQCTMHCTCTITGQVGVVTKAHAVHMSIHYNLTMESKHTTYLTSKGKFLYSALFSSPLTPHKLVVVVLRKNSHFSGIVCIPPIQVDTICSLVPKISPSPIMTTLAASMVTFGAAM